jgi:hypothetical protein
VALISDNSTARTKQLQRLGSISLQFRSCIRNLRSECFHDESDAIEAVVDALDKTLDQYARPRRRGKIYAHGEKPNMGRAAA